MGTRKVPFSRELYIERDDFMEDPPKKFFRLAPGREVRLRYAYFVTCTWTSSRTTSGEVVELRCTYDPETRGGDAPDGRKVKGTLHWVSAEHASRGRGAALRPPLRAREPGRPGGSDFKTFLNPDSLECPHGCRVEPSLADRHARAPLPVRAPGLLRGRRRATGTEPRREGRANGTLVFNRTVTLRDTWAKELAEQIGAAKARSLVGTEAAIVATGNPGCIMQIRAHLKRVGSTARVAHPIELLLPRREPE